MNKLLVPAFHEAGHAVVALALDLPLKGCLVRSYFGGLTVLHVPVSAISPDRHLLWALAGPIAEERSGLRLTESPLSVGEREDIEHARAILAAQHAVAPDSSLVTAALEPWRTRTKAMVDRRWAHIRRVAERLADDYQLSGEQVRRLYVCQIGRVR